MTAFHATELGRLAFGNGGKGATPAKRSSWRYRQQGAETGHRMPLDTTRQLPEGVRRLTGDIRWNGHCALPV